MYNCIFLDSNVLINLRDFSLLIAPIHFEVELEYINILIILSVFTLTEIRKIAVS